MFYFILHISTVIKSSMSLSAFLIAKIEIELSNIKIYKKCKITDVLDSMQQIKKIFRQKSAVDLVNITPKFHQNHLGERN